MANANNTNTVVESTTANVAEVAIEATSGRKARKSRKAIEVDGQTVVAEVTVVPAATRGRKSAPLHEEEIALVREYCEAGEMALAAMPLAASISLGRPVSAHTVKRIIAECGLTYVKPAAKVRESSGNGPGAPPSPDTVAAAAELPALIAEGLNMPEIADRLNITTAKVRTALKIANSSRSEDDQLTIAKGRPGARKGVSRVAPPSADEVAAAAALLSQFDGNASALKRALALAAQAESDESTDDAAGE